MTRPSVASSDGHPPYPPAVGSIFTDVKGVHETTLFRFSQARHGLLGCLGTIDPGSVLVSVAYFGRVQG